MQAAVLADVVGVIASIVGLGSFFHSRPNYFKAQVGSSSWLWGIHFGLLGSPVTMLTQFAIGARTFASIKLGGTRYSHVLFWVASLIFCGLALPVWEGWVSILPVAAAINSTYALSFRGNLGMRVQMLGSSALWIANGIYWHSVPAVITEVIAVCINFNTIYRLHALTRKT